MTSAAPPAPARARRWSERAVLAVLLLATAGGYLWRLDTRGNGNPFYAAAVQAGTKSWTAFFFGSLDSGNLITVDKPPASLWVMELSGRLFGFGAWSMFVPQALMGVVSVAVLAATVRRIAGPVPALLAGALLAVTPVVFTMFRFNDPDALLMLLLTCAAYTMVRALQSGRTRWLLLTGAAVGLGFLAKELQAFLPVPGFAVAYLWAAPTSLGRRLVQLLAAGATLVVAAGWWVLTVALWPTADRPYLDGSADNSELSRALVSNGLARLLTGPGATVRSLQEAGDPPGLTRLVDAPVGGYIAWLLPAAILLLVVGLWLTRRAPRTDLTRAALLLFGGWLVVGGLVLSLMGGVFHEYYTLVLAPPIVGLVVVGAHLLWGVRHRWAGRLLMAATAVGTVAWARVLLFRDPLVSARSAAAVTVVALVLATAPLLAGVQRRWVAGLVVAAVLFGVAVPPAMATYAGALPRRATAVAAAAKEPPHPGQVLGLRHTVVRRPTGRHGARATHAVRRVRAERRVSKVDRRDLRPLAALLETAGTRWSAATNASSAAAMFELASNTAVMAIGGFTGTRPVPTAAQFEADVRAGLVHYYVVDGPPPVPGTAAYQIAAWVEHHFSSRSITGRRVFDLMPGTSRFI